MANIQARLRRGKQRIERRLAGSREELGGPMLSGAGIRVELASKIRAIGTGGIGLVYQLARRTGLEPQGLAGAIDRRVQVLKVHRPYHESDHVLNLAYNALCEGTRLEDIELRRNDEVFLDALGSERIPDPTTAGDFCRRFTEMDIRRLMGAIDEARQNVWARQPREFFRRATIDLSRHAGDHHGPVQAGNGHLLPGHLGLSSAGRFAGLWPAKCCGWSTAAATGPATKAPPPRPTRRSPCAGRPDSPESCCAATRPSARRSTWTIGTRKT